MNSIDPIDKWFLDRNGKFTCSENYKLLGKGKVVGQLWSDTATGYIEQKAIETVTRLDERPQLEEVKSILNGRMYEYPAFERYVKETRNYSLTFMGSEHPVFLEDESVPDEAGGTPDAANITANHRIDMGTEIKCPVNSGLHFKRLSWKDQWDIKENYMLVYTQIQHLMMITGAQEWHFVSFDDRQLFYSKKIKIIPVYTDQKFQDNLHVRLQMAVKEKYKLLSNYFDMIITCKDDLKLVA